MIPIPLRPAVHAVAIALGAILGAGVLATTAPAQQAPLRITPDPQTTGSVTVAPEAARGAREEELAKVREQQKRQAEVEAKLKAELDSIGEDRRKLNQLLITSAKARLMVNVNAFRFSNCCMLLLTFSSSGNKTKRGSGHHQRMCSPSYQGKMPLR